MTSDEPEVVGLGARAHLFVHPDFRQQFIDVFRKGLDCDVVDVNVGFSVPVILVRFPDGSAFSAEFNALARSKDSPEDLHEGAIQSGAWLEFRTNDVEHYMGRLRGIGTPSFRHPGSTHDYFQAPGGQVFRLIDVAYTGP